MTGDRITRMEQVRSMTPDEIADAHRSGRIDLHALAAERAADDRAASARANDVRRTFRNGSITADQAIEQMTEIHESRRNRP